MSPSVPTPLTLDVRPRLKEGKEPLSVILAAKSRLEARQTLRLLAPFQPRPLYAHFEAEGFTITAKPIEGTDWEINLVPPDSPESIEHGDTKALDLRAKDRDEIMHRGTAAVADLERGQILKLLSSQHPQALLSELNSESSDYDCEPDQTGSHYVTTIWRL